MRGVLGMSYRAAREPEGHRVLYRDFILTPTTILMQDACLLGLPESLTCVNVGI